LGLSAKALSAASAHGTLSTSAVPAASSVRLALGGSEPCMRMTDSALNATSW
jgi:hypothetical protein